MAITPEEIAAITAAVAEALKPMIVEEANKTAGAHITNRNKSFEEKLNEKLSSLGPKIQPQEEDAPEKATLATRMGRLEEENKRLILQNKMEKEANARAVMRANAETVLLKGKVNPEFIKAAVAQLMHEDKLIEMDETTGTGYFKSNSNGYEEKLSIEDGVSSWLKTSGKAFIAQPKAQGTGQRDIRSAGKSQEDNLSQEEYQSAVVEMIRNLR